MTENSRNIIIPTGTAKVRTLSTLGRVHDLRRRRRAAAVPSSETSMRFVSRRDQRAVDRRGAEAVRHDLAVDRRRRSSPAAAGRSGGWSSSASRLGRPPDRARSAGISTNAKSSPLRTRSDSSSARLRRSPLVEGRLGREEPRLASAARRQSTPRFHSSARRRERTVERRRSDRRPRSPRSLMSVALRRELLHAERDPHEHRHHGCGRTPSQRRSGIARLRTAPCSELRDGDR